MFTWKRLFLSLGFLFLIAIIGWTTWYFTIVLPKLIGNPIVLYNTKPLITANGASDAVPVKTSQVEKFSQEDVTAETHKRPEVVSQPERERAENAAASPTQKESDQHAHSSQTHQHNVNEDETAKEIAKAQEHIRVAEEYIAIVQTNQVHNEENRKARLYASAKKLNSLSAEEQQAYFEDIRSGKMLEGLHSILSEASRNSAQSFGISDEMRDMILDRLMQTMREEASEAGAKRYLEKLRKYGFEPKF